MKSQTTLRTAADRSITTPRARSRRGAVIDCPPSPRQGSSPARLGLRLSSEAKQLVEQAASALGVTVNAFATVEIVERSRQIVKETQGLSFDNKARDRFLAMLDSPAGPNEALIRAAERYKTGRVSGDKYHFKG
jgi:uncharacterized protein (DUF1778 family)